MPTIAFAKFDPIPSRPRRIAPVTSAKPIPKYTLVRKYGIRSVDVRESDMSSTKYTTVTPTVFSIAGGGGYVTRKDTPYTPYDAEQKRGLYETSQPTPTPFLEPRQAQFPTFASQCQGNADRLSSACTCLIGYTPGVRLSCPMNFGQFRFANAMPQTDDNHRSHCHRCLHHHRRLRSSQQLRSPPKLQWRS